MHNRKGSLTFGLSPARSRTGTRWSGLLIFIALTFLLFYKSNHSFWFLSSPPYEHSCSTHLSNPSILTSSKHSFYRTTIQNHPVDTLAQLPLPESGRSPRIQHKFITDASSYRETVVRSRRHAAVRATFKKYWSAEKDAAMDAAMAGDSRPVMTEQTTILIESLENFWIMGLTEEFQEAVASMVEINFEPHDQVTSLLQTTRLLYALLSAYDLQKCRDIHLLDKALELGDMLYTFFDTSSRLPIISWNATKVADGVEQELSGNATLAELTTYNLAFVRLSQLTGDIRFYDAVTRVINILKSQQSSTKIPGLWPAEVNLQTLDLTSDNTFNVDAASGPAYAQHTLMTRLLAIAPTVSPYTSMSTSALDAIIQHILFRPVTPTNESIMMASPAYTSQRYHITLTHNLDISSCTLGSTLALSAALTRNDTHLTYARLLTEGCIWTTLHAPPSFNGNIMPRNFSMLACSSSKLSNSDEDCSFDPSVWPEQEYPGFEKIWDKKGPSVRPEVVMSLFALYRVTGEERWMEVGWQMWEGVERVMEEKIEQALNGDTERDDEEFRMTMQTLKYFYLLFSKPDMLSLDEWVFASDGGILWAGSV